MNLNDLLKSKGIGPEDVLVLRHRPHEPQLNDVLPWLAADKPDLFNAYQQAQRERVEGAMTRAKYVASFIGHEPGKAVFVGLYSMNGSKTITSKQYWEIPANIELRAFGMDEAAEASRRPTCLWFDLLLTDFYAHWKGKLIVDWPGLERSWYRWAHNPKNEMPVFAILDESALEAAVEKWDEMEFTWAQLSLIPNRLKSKLREWRGIYYIFDTSDGKGYVGSAYGQENLLGRWENYAASGHGGNALLRPRDPKTFLFTILQLDAPNRDARDVIHLENSWKKRLHTRAPFGLNDN